MFRIANLSDNQIPVIR